MIHHSLMVEVSGLKYNNTAAIGEGSAPPTLKKQAFLLPTYGEAQ